MVNIEQALEVETERSGKREVLLTDFIIPGAEGSINDQKILHE